MPLASDLCLYEGICLYEDICFYEDICLYEVTSCGWSLQCWVDYGSVCIFYCNFTIVKLPLKMVWNSSNKLKAVFKRKVLNDSFSGTGFFSLFGHYYPAEILKNASDKI